MQKEKKCERPLCENETKNEHYCGVKCAQKDLGRRKNKYYVPEKKEECFICHMLIVLTNTHLKKHKIASIQEYKEKFYKKHKCYRPKCTNETYFEKYCSLECQRKDIGRISGIKRKGRSRPKSFCDKIREIQNRPEVRLKKRMATLQRIRDSHGQIFPGYNIDGCKFLDEYGQQHGYNFQHAMNGGEYCVEQLGYFIDGYDVDKNVSVEIDEAGHFDNTGNLREQDIQRQIEIEKSLGCTFIRFKIENEKFIQYM